MDYRLFNRFADMIDMMPPRGIIKCLELQCRMIEDDFTNQRDIPMKAAISIRNFYQIIQAAGNRQKTPPVADLPIEHVAFYKKTVHRLIQAGELPSGAVESFQNEVSVCA